MIFSARQLQEKCIEHQVALYQVFIDPTKAFYAANRSALWTILGKLGCPPEFVNMFKQLHRDMKAHFNFNGSLSEPIAIDNRVKQGDISSPTLFSIFFAVTLSYTFQDCDIGVVICFRTTVKIFNLTRSNAKSKTFQNVVWELLYPDDADFIAHTEEDMQAIMDLFCKACTAFGLTISLKKTKVMFTPPLCHPYAESNIFIEGTGLDVVDSFVYLGSTLSLETDCVWSDRAITIKTKLSVYESYILTALLYSSETWTTYRQHIKP